MDEYDEFASINELDLDILPNVSTSTFHGMRIFDSIDDCQSESFFLVEVKAKRNLYTNRPQIGTFQKVNLLCHLID
jgi:hypothetical protein